MTTPGAHPRTPGENRYHCHYCNLFFFRPPEDAAQTQQNLECPRCHTGFVEQVSVVSPQAFSRIDMMLQELQLLQQAFRSISDGSSGGDMFPNGLGLAGTMRFAGMAQGPVPAPLDAVRALKDFTLRISHIRANPACVICMDDWVRALVSHLLALAHGF